MDSLAHPRSVLLPVQGLSSARTGAPWRSVLMVVAGLTLARIAALFLTPLQLYPDEAQYWLWSRTLDWGYYSKPPVIAWLIWSTTHVGGDAVGGEAHAHRALHELRRVVLLAQMAQRKAFAAVLQQAEQRFGALVVAEVAAL